MDGKEARLVYTTDNSKGFQNETPSIVEKTEIVSSMYEDIDKLNSNWSEEQLRSLWRIVILFLQSGGKTINQVTSEIANKWTPLQQKVDSSKRRKFIENQLQTMKYASHLTIYSKSSLWQIQPLKSTIDELLDFMIEHRNDRFNKKKRDEMMLKHGSHVLQRKKVESTSRSGKIPKSPEIPTILTDGKKVDIEMMSDFFHLNLKIEKDLKVKSNIDVTKNSVGIQLSW